MSEDLKPCPFCESTRVRPDYVPHGDEKAHYVACPSCGCEGPWHKTPGGAAEAWNRRADGWIDIRSQKPPQGKKVLTLAPGGWIDIGCWMGSYFTGPSNIATHWQPLPAAPKAGQA